MQKHDVIIVGGGPVGLYAAKLLTAKKIDFLLLEAEKGVGGQPTLLYPEKPVDDVISLSSVPAKEIARILSETIDPSRIVNESPVSFLEENEGEVKIKSAREEYIAKFVLLATGLGFQKPRTLGLADEDKCQNILYALKDVTIMKNKRIVIFGGGDSALDWARVLSGISPFVSLVHRRKEFRGDPKTIEGCKIAIYVPYIPDHLSQKDGHCDSIVIKNVEDGALLTLPLDFALVNYGQIPTPSTFSLPMSAKGFGIAVNNEQRATQRIYAIGDCAFVEGARKRIQPGFEQAEAAISSLEKRLRASR